MKKEVYQKNGKLVVEHSFDSLSEYCDYLEEGVFNPKITSRTSMDSNRNDWSGSASYAESMQLCLYGDYSDKFGVLLKLKDELDTKLTEKRRKSRQVDSVVGYIPHVPNFIKGFPLQMITTEFTEVQESNYITIYFNVSQLQTYTQEQFYHKGVLCLSLIEHLETLGYHVTLNLLAASHCNNQMVLTYFNLKRENQRLDLRNLFFPMTNVSFLRRLHFRLREITPELDAGWTTIYGYSLKSTELKGFLDLSQTSIVFAYPDELGIEGKDLLADAKRCYNALGLNDII